MVGIYPPFAPFRQASFANTGPGQALQPLRGGGIHSPAEQRYVEYVPFRKHLRAAATHERAALLHEKAARFWTDANDLERSGRENNLASKEREGAALERDRARAAGYVSG